MASKRERLRQLLTQRTQESQRTVLPQSVVDYLITTPTQRRQHRQELADIAEQIRLRQEINRRVGEQVLAQEALAAQNEDHRWLWDDVLPVTAEMSDELMQQLSADDRLHRLAVEGLYGANWQEFTTILREKYGLYETGYRYDINKRRELGTHPQIAWKLYVENRPDVQQQSPKLKRRERMPSGYYRLTDAEKKRREQYRQQRNAYAREQYARRKRGQNPPPDASDK